MIGTCGYCKSKDKDLRPYGKNGALICFSCGMKPENKKETERQFAEIMKDKDTLIVIEVDQIH